MVGRLTMLLAAVAVAGCAAHGQATATSGRPRLRRPVEALVSELSSPEPEARAAAIWELARVGKLDGAVVDRLIRAREDTSAVVREAAVWALDGKSVRPYDRPPRPRRQGHPEYPWDAFERKIQGTVVARILIAESGRVVHAEVRQSVPGLDAAALECVRQWVFEPALLKGRPIPAVAMTPVSFSID